ncbi:MULTISPECIES: hypothetical protein [unclassified Xanthomonas]|uniref:hypothetical protein n=1 Tax=Xanthomonas sp. LMG 8992 TaxID=1591157 RepID=UPI00136E3D8B|nr:hypothetical protein [Xanthomonas sp. LMG 8992]
MSLRGRVYKLLILSLFLMGGCTQKTVPGTNKAASIDGEIKSTAPKVACSIKLNYLCIIQADARLSMVDSNGYRFWKMAVPGHVKNVVIIQESKNCETLTDVHPLISRKSMEKSESNDIFHVLDFSIDRNNECHLIVKYLAGDTTLAREALQLAEDRLYFCDKYSCKNSLLKIRN